jgi:sterol desaturase/sphingolipid hydroxylase (fatty acid hydroxylase superfamily)
MHLFLGFILALASFETLSVTVSTYYLQKLLHSKRFLPSKIKLNPRDPNDSQFKFEVYQQLKSVFISILTGYGLVFWVIFNGQSRIYYQLSDYSIIWLILTVPAMILASDLYLYVIHRCLNLKFLYTKIHLVHHRSIRVNVFSSYSLDVIEAVAYTLFLAIFIYFFPTHILNFIIFMIVTVVYNFYIHSGWEILPVQNSIVKVFNTATLHHIDYIKRNYSFALYTSIWDRLFGTYLDKV